MENSTGVVEEDRIQGVRRGLEGKKIGKFQGVGENFNGIP